MNRFPSNLLPGTASRAPTSQRRTAGHSAFWLVVIMLVVLTILVIVLWVITNNLSANDKFIEYSKWALSLLLGAFGAWIGAGAAYFFGKENLAESSASTEAALNIQLAALQGEAKPDRIKELALTAMNKEFMFYPSNTKQEVIAKLKLPQYTGYWWVPVFDQGKKGILEDVVHARVFWDTSFQDNDPISKITADIDKSQDLRVLHSTSFFVKVALDDEIADVTRDMNKSGAAVGVVTDETGKPTYCFTKQVLQNAQK